MKRIFIAVLAILLVAGPAWGASGAAKKNHAGGRTYKLCDAETAPGVCDNSDGVHLYADVSGFNQFTFFFSETGSGATCDVYAGDYYLLDALPPELDDVGWQINSVSLSSSFTSLSYEAPFSVFWIVCTAGTEAHTVSLQAARAR